MQTETVQDVLRCFVKDRMPAGTPKAQANFLECLFPALIASLPAFLDALMKCLAGQNGPGKGDHEPGTRVRCNV